MHLLNSMATGNAVVVTVKIVYKVTITNASSDLHFRNAMFSLLFTSRRDLFIGTEPSRCLCFGNQ